MITSPQSPVIVAGMHRSGTSMTAGLLAGMGVDMGRDLIAADSDNRRGYFEDATFIAFNREVLATCVDGQAAGWPDWGWEASGGWSEPEVARWLAHAKERIQASGAASGPWGWKDPRTTLLLDLWASASPNARIVLVYRPPWEVADSMQRLAHPIFRQHPEYALPIWTWYNRRVLEFHSRHRERCLLVSANALVQDPEAFGKLVRSRWPELGLREPLAGQVSTSDFSSNPAPDPLPGLLRRTDPEVTELFAALEAVADLPARLPEPPATRFTGPPAEPIVCSIIIPCFDQGDYLIEAVASVERHAPEDAELLIIDDASKDPRTKRVFAALETAGYRVMHVPKNGGLSAARNTGIAATLGEFILPLDSDNRLRSGFIEGALEVMASSPEVGVVYPDRKNFGAESGIQKLDAYSAAELVLLPRIDACAVFRRRVWEAGGFDTGLDMWEDWEFWIRAAAAGWELRHWSGVGFDYRVREGSMSRRNLEPSKVRRRIVRIHERNAPFIAAALGPRWTPARYVREVSRMMTPPRPLTLRQLRSAMGRMRWQGPKRLWHLLRRLAGMDRPPAAPANSLQDRGSGGPS